MESGTAQPGYLSEGRNIMPVCCRCNGSGRCANCSCAKSGTLCVDCLPSRKGQCLNQPSSPRSPLAEGVETTPDPEITPTETSTMDLSPTETHLTPQETTPSPEISTTITTDKNVNEGAEVNVCLPPYLQKCSLCFKWGSCDGTNFQ